MVRIHTMSINTNKQQATIFHHHYHTYQAGTRPSQRLLLNMLNCMQNIIQRIGVGVTLIILSQKVTQLVQLIPPKGSSINILKI